ncbi:hypothetical protein [Pseudonocardia sp. TRM90224]|nr:hypothetical protein [Pseudonocardia sp. TRM90224]
MRQLGRATLHPLVPVAVLALALLPAWTSTALLAAVAGAAAGYANSGST